MQMWHIDGRWMNHGQLLEYKRQKKEGIQGVTESPDPELKKRKKVKKEVEKEEGEKVVEDSSNQLEGDHAVNEEETTSDSESSEEKNLEVVKKKGRPAKKK